MLRHIVFSFMQETVESRHISMLSEMIILPNYGLALLDYRIAEDLAG